MNLQFQIKIFIFFIFFCTHNLSAKNEAESNRSGLQLVPSKVTLNLNGIKDYVAKIENSLATDIEQIEIKKDKDFTNGVILAYSNVTCGMGSCTYYSFIKNKRGYFDFAGPLEGRFLESKEIKNSDLPEIWTQVKTGLALSEKKRWLYNLEKNKYELQ